MDEEYMSRKGVFSWAELMTTDTKAAAEFYKKLFGWETEDMSMPGMAYTVVKTGGEGIGGIMQMPEQPEGMHPAWAVYVTVENVDESAKEAERLGGKIHEPPTDIPDVGRFAVIQDPQGAFINIIAYK